MKTMQDWFDAYGHSHQNATNKTIHWICVPAIFYSLIGLLSLIPLGPIEAYLPEPALPYLHVGTLLIVLALFFFASLSIMVAIGMAVISFVVLSLVAIANTALGEQAWLFYVTIFVVAWIGQFIGHKIEGAKPSFLEDLKFLLIGPAWLLHFIYRKIGIKY